jgi:hypothetical protein
MISPIEKLHSGGTSVFASHPTNASRMKQARARPEAALRPAARSSALP